MVHSTDSGVCVSGLCTTVFPASSAGTTSVTPSESG